MVHKKVITIIWCILLYHVLHDAITLERTASFFYWIFMWIIMVFGQCWKHVYCLIGWSVRVNNEYVVIAYICYLLMWVHHPTFGLFHIQNTIVSSLIPRMKEIYHDDFDFWIFKFEIWMRFDKNGLRMGTRIRWIGTVDRWRGCRQFAFPLFNVLNWQRMVNGKRFQYGISWTIERNRQMNSSTYDCRMTSCRMNFSFVGIHLCSVTPTYHIHIPLIAIYAKTFTQTNKSRKINNDVKRSQIHL